MQNANDPGHLAKSRAPFAELPFADPALPPLSGIRVLDASRVLAGPYCAAILADLGAEVIRIEHPSEPDEVRRWAPVVDGSSTAFAAMNHGKQGVALDLSHPEGLAVFKQLLTTADVLVENFRPGTLERRGLSAEIIQEVAPALVHCSIRAFPGNTPMAAQPGYEASMQAITGIMSSTGEEDGAPVRCGPSVVDLGTGMASVIAILAALRERDRSGLGQYVEPALLRTATALLGVQVASCSATGLPSPRRGSGHEALVPYRIFDCSDGPLFIAAGNDRLWPKLCAVLGLADASARVPTPTLSERIAARDEVNTSVEQATRQWRRDDLLRALSDKGVPAAPVNTVNEYLDDPALLACGVVHDAQIDGAPDAVVAGPLFAGLQNPVRTRAPTLGQHTDTVLAGIGISHDRIAALRSAGAIL
jgi:crotonobetainyl-CoA:carnitine CoA-transferase CaiB-like acyl-CoA transferase